MYNLTYLDLTSCDIQDSGINKLKSLTKLRAIGLRSTRVTSAGIYELSRALNDDAIIQSTAFTLFNGQRVDLGELP
jgi:hypothetical protein